MQQDRFSDFLKVSPHRTRVEHYFVDANTSNITCGIASERTVFLCFTNRCGSTLVASLLASAGVFGQPSEFLNYEHFNGDDLIGYCNRNGIKSFSGYISNIIKRYSSPRGIFSSKISIDQLSWLTDANLIGTRFKNSTFIYVVRKNIIAQAVSLAIAVQTGQWTSLHQGSAKRCPEFRYDQIRGYAESIANQNDWFETYFDLHNIQPIPIVYEELLPNPHSIFAKISNHLGEEIQPIEEYSINVLPLERQSGSLNRLWESRYREMCTDYHCYPRLLSGDDHEPRPANSG